MSRRKGTGWTFRTLRGWGELLRMLSYKARWYGRTLVAINRWYPSSKRCSACGHELESLSLAVREWTCPTCGAVHDRDVNAATNTKAEGSRCSPVESRSRPNLHGREGRHARALQETHSARGGIPSPLGDREEVNFLPGDATSGNTRPAPAGSCSGGRTRWERGFARP